LTGKKMTVIRIADFPAFGKSSPYFAIDGAFGGEPAAEQRFDFVAAGGLGFEHGEPAVEPGLEFLEGAVAGLDVRRFLHLAPPLRANGFEGFAPDDLDNGSETVVTSGRKPRAHSFMSYAKLFMRVTFLGSRGVRSRRGLEFWYEPEREKSK
jgi:hypothetical protein